MKIGIVSDIHAHFEPLERAVSLFRSQGVDQIICAGDLVDGGWDDTTVIDYIRSHNILSVRGNHDRQAFTEQAERWNFEEDLDNDFGDELDSYRGQYINSLPSTRQFNWEGSNIFLAHGSPWSDTYHIFPNVSIDICRRIFNVTQANIVILGHTHIPMKLQFNNKWIFNSGALCGNRADLKRTCGILALPKMQFDIFDIDSVKPIKLETTIIDDTLL